MAMSVLSIKERRSKKSMSSLFWSWGRIGHCQNEEFPLKIEDANSNPVEPKILAPSYGSRDNSLFPWSWCLSWLVLLFCGKMSFHTREFWPEIVFAILEAILDKDLRFTRPRALRRGVSKFFLLLMGAYYAISGKPYTIVMKRVIVSIRCIRCVLVRVPKLER